MKKGISLLLICTLLFSLCACGRNDDIVDSQPDEENTTELVIEVDSENAEPVTEESAEIVVDENTETLVYETIKIYTEESTETTTKFDINSIGSVPNMDAADYKALELAFNTPGDVHFRNITYDTPEHKGIELRREPNKNSECLVVIPEGTEVALLDNLKFTKDYNKVFVTIDGVCYAGFVMQRYMTTFTGALFDSRVCYNTPEHKGVVLRDKATYYSEAIMVVPEGTEVRIMQIPENGYYPVAIFYNEEIFYGHILEKYVEPIE